MSEHFFGMTDTGRQRANNEDAFVARRLRDGRLLLCVIDGVGGYEGGEVAAALAKGALEKAAAAGSLKDAPSFRDVFASIQRSISAARRQHPQLAQMACVLTAALVDEAAGQFQYAHVGDTRLYLYRDGSLVKISSDHSFVGLLEDSGRITEAEAMAHPKRNEIDRALGFGGELPADFVETGTSPFLPGDGLLLCSDGLSDLVTRGEMEAVLQRTSSLSEKAAALVAAANERGGKDNITVVLALHSARRDRPRPVGAPRPLEQTVEVRPPGTKAQASAAIPPRAPGAGRPLWPWITGGLVMLLLLLLGWWWTRCSGVTPVPVAVNEPAPPGFGQQLASVRDTMRLAPDSVFLQPDSLFVGQDSLLLLGNPGTVLRPDSGRSTWQIAPTVRLLVLSRLELRDADLRVSSSNVDAIRFDSARLVNVSVGVGQPLHFRDTIVSGTLYQAPVKGGKQHD